MCLIFDTQGYFACRETQNYTSVNSWVNDDNLSKCQWIFTKLGIFIDIVEIWFGIVSGQISSIFDSYLLVICPSFHFRMITLVYQMQCVHWYCEDLVRDCWWANFVNFWLSYLPRTCQYFHFWMITLVNINGFSPNLVCALRWYWGDLL